MVNAEEVKTREYETLVVLSNAVQLGANVIRDVAGNDIADGYDGERLDSAELNNTMAAKIKSYLKNPTVGGRT